MQVLTGTSGFSYTAWRGSFYPEKLAARGLGFLRPSNDEREEINRIIMDELVCGVFETQAVEYFQKSQ